MTTTRSGFIKVGIGLDPDTPRDVEAMKCRACGEASDTGVDIDEARDWAMQHTGQTEHDRFELVTTNYYLVKRINGPFVPVTALGC